MQLPGTNIKHKLFTNHLPHVHQVGSVAILFLSSATFPSSSAQPSSAAFPMPSWYFSRAPFKVRNIS